MQINTFITLLCLLCLPLPFLVLPRRPLLQEVVEDAAASLPAEDSVDVAAEDSLHSGKGQ